MIIGITGGTGSGKTTLLKLMQEHGVLILDCDAIYHDLLKTDTSLLCAIESRFPGTLEGGQLNRKKLGQIVFSDPAALADLNKITHQAIHNQILQRLNSKPEHAAIDAVALIESGMDQLCQVTVAVIAPEEQRIGRLIERDNISEEYARNRINAQPTTQWYRQHCNYTLENNGSKTDFQRKCLAFLQELGIMDA